MGTSIERRWVFCQNGRPVAYSIAEFDKWLSKQNQKHVKVIAQVAMLDETVSKIRNVCIKNSNEVTDFSLVSAMGPDWERHAIPIDDSKIVSDRNGVRLYP